MVLDVSRGSLGRDARRAPWRPIHKRPARPSRRLLVLEEAPLAQLANSYPGVRHLNGA